MSLGRMEELQREVAANPSAEAYRALLTERVAYLKAMEEREAAAKARGVAAQARLDAANSSANASRTNLAPTAKGAKEHLLLWIKVQRELEKRTRLLTAFLSHPYNCPEPFLNLVASWLDNWGSFFPDIQKDLKQLKLFAQDHPGTLPPLQTLYDPMDTMCRLQLNARSYIGHERRLLAMRNETSVEVYLDHVDSLHQWLSNATQRVDRIFSKKDCEDFVSYLSRNRTKVEEGLLALTAEAEILKAARDERVSARLQDCFRLWVEVVLKAYEKIHDQAISFHVEMGVPDLCRKYMEEDGPAVDHFLSTTAMNQLRGRDSTVKRSECNQLLEAHRVLMLLCSHLTTYQARDKAVSRAFKCLAAAAQSKVTYFMLHLPAYEEYEGRDEHHQRLQELQEWVEVHCQKRTFMKLLERTKDIRAMLDDYDTARRTP